MCPQSPDLEVFHARFSRLIIIFRCPSLHSTALVKLEALKTASISYPSLTVALEPSSSSSHGNYLESPTLKVIPGLPKGHLRWHLWKGRVEPKP